MLESCPSFSLWMPWKLTKGNPSTLVPASERFPTWASSLCCYHNCLSFCFFWGGSLDCSLKVVGLTFKETLPAERCLHKLSSSAFRGLNQRLFSKSFGCCMGGCGAGCSCGIIACPLLRAQSFAVAPFSSKVGMWTFWIKLVLEQEPETSGFFPSKCPSH